MVSRNSHHSIPLIRPVIYDQMVESDCEDNGVKTASSNAKATQKSFQMALEINDIFYEILSFLEIPYLQKLSLINRQFARAINSPALWNIQVHNIQRITRNTHLSFTTSQLSRDPGSLITPQEKRALHIYLTIYRNLRAFFNSYSTLNTEFPFTISLEGIIHFSNPGESNTNNHYLLTRNSGKMERTHQHIGDYYQNLRSAKALYAFAVIRENGDASFFEETSKSLQHRIIFLSIRVLNTLALQKMVSPEDIRKGFQTEDISEAFDDVIEDEKKLLQRSPTSVSSKTAEEKKLLKEEIFKTCSPICPQEIVKQLPLPLFNNSFNKDDLVAVRKYDGSYQFGFIFYAESGNNKTNPTKERRYHILTLTKGRNSTPQFTITGASAIACIPERITKKICEKHSAFSEQ